ncbi:MAG: tRNA pseudouridine(55) synthase TruB [Pseudomonadota bacterium]|nr:tRNA pseudouridine(55) synthase TruB [Pseudomonadota bacterium]
MGMRRIVDGLLLFDKPSGITSNSALQQVRRMYGALKAGHTGTLDPLASGLLPLCFGEATKFSSYLLDADKQYEATVKLGVTTDTGDCEGNVVSVRPVKVNFSGFLAVLENFRGEIEQVPPMYSALKVKGKPLYDYARKGLVVERSARKVKIHGIELMSFDMDCAVIRVHCSKGTYIRVLAEDIGKELGCGAHLAGLRRTASSGFKVSEATGLVALGLLTDTQKDALLLPVDILMRDWPKVALDDKASFCLSRGQPVRLDVATSGIIRLYGASGKFLGMGEAQEGRVIPRRLIVERVDANKT